jgi:hypothetical protein
MNVKPDVPYVQHSNQSIRNDIYSKLIVIPDLKINIPETGQRITVFVPTGQDRTIVKSLLEQIGFNGLIRLTEIRSPEGTEYSVTIEP